MDIPNTVILYDAECSDGFGAAWAAWRKFGDAAIYLPVYHRKPVPNEVEGRDVYMLDICYEQPIIEDMLKKVKRLVVIDHHATSAVAVTLAHESIYDRNHSGCVLAWRYFHSEVPVPKMLEYIEDIDLWKFELPDSKEINERMSLREFDFQVWDKQSKDLEDPKWRVAYAADGRVLMEKKKKMVEKAVGNAEEVEFEGYKCLMVNSPFLVSEIGHALTVKMPPIGIVWSRRKDVVIVSLRSDGTVDVSQLAQKYGGGGHPAASAFSWEEKDFLKFRRE